MGTPPPPAALSNRRGLPCSQRRWEDRIRGARPPLGEATAARRLASQPAPYCRASLAGRWCVCAAAQRCMVPVFSVHAPLAAAHGIRVGTATALVQGAGIHRHRAPRCPVARRRPRIGRSGDLCKMRPDGGSPHGSLAQDGAGCHRSRSPSCTRFHRQGCGGSGWREPQGGPHAARGDCRWPASESIQPLPRAHRPAGWRGSATRVERVVWRRDAHGSARHGRRPAARVTPPAAAPGWGFRPAALCQQRRAARAPLRRSLASRCGAGEPQ